MWCCVGGEGEFVAVVVVEASVQVWGCCGDVVVYASFLWCSVGIVLIDTSDRTQDIFLETRSGEELTRKEYRVFRLFFKQASHKNRDHQFQFAVVS